MVSSAIFGAAAGTGLALFVGMTILVYRYYAVKRKGKYWSSLDRWPDPPSTKRTEARQEECSEHCHDSSSSHVLNCWRKQQKNYYAVQTRVCTKCLRKLLPIYSLQAAQALHGYLRLLPAESHCFVCGYFLWTLVRYWCFRFQFIKIRDPWFY